MRESSPSQEEDSDVHSLIAVLVVIAVCAAIVALNRSERSFLRQRMNRKANESEHAARLAKQTQLFMIAPGASIAIRGKTFIVQAVMVMLAQGLLPRWRLVLGDKVWLDIQEERGFLAPIWLAESPHNYAGPLPGLRSGRSIADIVIDGQPFECHRFYTWHYGPRGSDPTDIMRAGDFYSRDAEQTSRFYQGLRFEQLGDRPVVTTGITQVSIDDIELAVQ